MESTSVPMRIGVALPQKATKADPIAVRDFAQAVEQLGYAHVEVYDHVLGADRETYPDLTGPYRLEHPFYEPFVLFGYLAGQTRAIELVTGVIILAQRQTALVAKQAAIVDVLSGGRLRLGVGTGWNPVEFAALGENFHNRGRRSEEQIAVLRALWTQERVTFRGQWHTIIDAGINPLPVQQPIPIWIGAGRRRSLRAAGVSGTAGSRSTMNLMTVAARILRPSETPRGRPGVTPTRSDWRRGSRSKASNTTTGPRKPRRGARWG